MQYAWTWSVSRLDKVTGGHPPVKAQTMVLREVLVRVRRR
jgi:hypothetical protein